MRKHLQRRPTEWFISHELCQKQLDDGWVGTAGVKRAFELWQDGWLEKKDVGNEVAYKYKGKWETKQVPVVVTREDGVRVAIIQEKLFEII